MSTEVKLLSYNTLASFGDTRRKDALIDFIRRESPDVGFFAEAYNPEDNGIIIQSAIDDLVKLGYRVTTAMTDRGETRSDRTGFIGIVRPEIGEGSVMNVDIRNGFLAKLKKTSDRDTLHIGGIHLDDRNEPARRKQVRALPVNLDVVMGDLNTMHRDALFARAIRAFKPVTEALPELDPDRRKVNRATWIASMAQRVVRMAEGSALEFLTEQRGLHDADPHMQPTIHGLAQLDHILVNDTIQTSNFTVHKDIRLSDHLPISVEIR